MLLTYIRSAELAPVAVSVSGVMFDTYYRVLYGRVDTDPA